MKTAIYTLDLLTPCFCSGANQAVAEIRASAIRGQLRWWFRTLGGFKSLSSIPLRDQEALIFGSTAGDEGSASKLIVRTTALTSTVVKDADELGAPMLSEKGYLLFPLRSNPKKNEYKGRGVLERGSFTLSLIWRGEPNIWADIKSLVTVFGHLGSLGFRSRRGYGAISPTSTTPLNLKEALAAFNSSNQAIFICQLSSVTNDPLLSLGKWLKDWRSHGRSVDHSRGNPQNKLPPHNTGFIYAKRDHDIGYGNINQTRDQPAYRAALGLPIIQRCNGTNNWEFGTGNNKGRFASPVLLRPHRTSAGKIIPLVIFVNAHKWPNGKEVYLNGQPRTVSTDLYEAMQLDRNLQPFNP